MEFKKYQHIERLGNDEVEDILIGTVYIFSKIDGSNGTLQLNDDGLISPASRKRVLTKNIKQSNLKNKKELIENKVIIPKGTDNQGFRDKYLKDNYEKFDKFLNDYPNYILRGEYLVPHTIKNYIKSAWRKFYVFDIEEVIFKDDGEIINRYINYEEYQPLLEKYDIDYIPLICKMINPSKEQVYNQLRNATFLMPDDGESIGEGIVIKNYEYTNRFGRTNWAKIVQNSFKEQNKKEMGVPILQGSHEVEHKIVNEFVTMGRLDKLLHKILQGESFQSKLIGQILGRMYHEIVNDELWNIVKKFKSPRIDFKFLNKCIIAQTKELLKEKGYM